MECGVRCEEGRQRRTTVDGWWELQCIHERNLLFFAGCIHERNLVFLKKKYSHLAMHAMVINFETLLFSKKKL
jgi:hypothetical protein